MSNNEQLLKELAEKLESQQKQFENYKAECKQLEQFLEEQNHKKEAEIRKLKEESINKQKGFKLLKAQNGQLEVEVASLKEQLASLAKNQHKQDEETKKVSQELQSVLDKNNLLEKIIQEKVNQLDSIKQIKEKLDAKAIEMDEKARALETELEINNKKIQQFQLEKKKIKEELQNQRNKKLQTSNTKVEVQTSKNNVDNEDQTKQIKRLSKQNTKLEKQLEKITSLKIKLERQIETLQKRNTKHEQSTFNYEKTIKSLKNKFVKVNQQKEQVQSNLKMLKETSPKGSPTRHKDIMIKENYEEEQDEITEQMGEYIPQKTTFSCLMLTKPHYVSPFLEVNDDKNIVKIFKSTRSGTFEKSLGLSKHKMDLITYDFNTLIEKTVSKVKQSENTHHAIIIYGVKKSTKKYIMADIMMKVKDYLVEKINQCHQGKIEAIFLKKSPIQEKNYFKSGNQKEDALEIIDQVICLGIKPNKKQEKIGSKKLPSKPKIRYCKIVIDDFTFQLGTSSYTKLSLSQKESQLDMLNNILYSKLPDILQSTISEKQIILTLSPLVNQYEDCRCTLNTTLCKGIQKFNLLNTSNQWKQWKGSPQRDELNDMAKKKLESFERQNEQISLRTRRLEEQCIYYRQRFDELELRLKGLLNTHNGQNNYLKKSPITLSYEKMLKFVHNVQSRNLPMALYTMMNLKASTVGYEDSNESLEAI